MADAVEAISSARKEHGSGGIRADTAQTVAAAFRRLRAIREASLFGSCDTDRRSRDPYFVVIESGQQAAAPARVSFDEAAHHYGKIALRNRIGPGVSDTVLRQMISCWRACPSQIASLRKRTLTLMIRGHMGQHSLALERELATGGKLCTRNS